MRERRKAMDREAESMLYRQRTIYSEDLMIDQGTAEDMIKRVMDQPKGMRSQYTIMQGEVVYQPNQIETIAQAFGLADLPVAEVENNGPNAFA
jgi:hypothetical protein